MDWKFLLACFLVVSSVSTYRTDEQENQLKENDAKKQIYDYITQNLEKEDEIENDEENDNEEENESLTELLNKDEENDYDDSIDLKEDKDSDELDRSSFKKDPLWGRRFRFRIRTPRIRLPRIRLPRIRLPRIRIPRIRIPRIRIPRIRIPRIRLPRIRLRSIRLPRIRLPRIRIKSKKGGDKKEKEIDCSHVQKLYNTMGCDNSWRKHVDPVFVDLFHSACFKHNICTLCMQSQVWTKTQCDARLKTDMELSCDKLTNEAGQYDEEVSNYCKTRVFALHILASIKTYPTSPSSICDQCVTPSGNPNVVVDL